MTRTSETTGDRSPAATESNPRSTLRRAAPPVLLFDGVCNLCHASVVFVTRHERAPVLRFCALQSSAGHSLLAAAGRESPGLESMMLIDGGRVLERSDAALTIARYLRAPWRWIAIVRILPRSWRDALYDFIAKRRYRWFGKQERVCLVPTPEMRSRILD